MDGTAGGHARVIRAFGREHLWSRVRARPVVPVPPTPDDVADWPDRRAPVQPHRNWLPRTAFQLPGGQFSRYRDMPEANLVDVIEEAVRRLTVDGVSVVRPLGSIAYARRSRVLDWSVVRDLDIWVYVSRATLATGEWGELHSVLQRNVHDVLVERGVFADLSSRTGYVYLRDDSCRRRMIELKLAELGWLNDGLVAAAGRNPTLVRPGRPAHATVPRIEWSGYVPHENHYASAPGSEPFRRVVRSMSRGAVVFAQHHAHAENLAEGLRVLGPSRLRQALGDERKLRRYLHKVSKKQMMLGVLLRDDELRIRGLERVVALRGDMDLSGRQARREILATTINELESLRHVDAPALRRWVEPSEGPHVGELAWLPVDDQVLG